MSSDRYLGMYRGEVINDNDPMGEGRVKIYVFGVYDDMPESGIPWALYSDPFMGGQQELGGFFVPDVGSHVWVFFEMGDPEQPVYFAGAPARGDGPSEARMKGQYPRNKVFKTMSGHVIEFDDSPGETRVRIAHQSGTQKTYADNGDAEEHIVGNLNIVVEKDATIYVKGNASETVEGNLVRTVKGNVTEIVQGSLQQSINGDHTTSIMGRRKEASGGGTEYHSTGNMNITGTRTDLNKGGGSSIEILEGEFFYSLEYAFTYGAAKDLVNEAGTNAPFDTPEDAQLKAESLASGEFPPEKEVTATETHSPADGSPAVIQDGCPVVEDERNPYDVVLGNGIFTVRDFTLKPVFKHPIQAQRGLSITDIICNMHHFALNAAEPLLAQFPNLRINSMFRRGSGGSQHNVGMACDFQLPSGTTNDYKVILDWIAENIAYDQCIIETSNGGRTWWIHLSHNGGSSSQRKQRLTYLGGSYSNGWNFV